MGLHHPKLAFNSVYGIFNSSSPSSHLQCHVTYEVCLQSSVNVTVRTTKQKIRRNYLYWPSKYSPSNTTLLTTFINLLKILVWEPPSELLSQGPESQRRLQN